MSTNPKLRSAVRLALGGGAGVLAAMAFVPGAQAQDRPAQPQEVEEIVVTGTRIARPDLATASPVTVVDRSVMLATGMVDVGDLLQRLPAMSGSPIGTTTNNGGDGAVEIDLRGMGVDRTVTLVNGHRTVDGGDFQTIPQAMIERIEILKDGASAVYGADAVAGVVNIITRRDFEGVSLELQNADHFDMDRGRQTSLSFLAGRVFDRGNFVFGAEYVDQEEAYQRDAPWAYFQDTYYIYPQGCEAQLTAPYDGTPQGGCYPIGSSRIPEGRLEFPTAGLQMNAGQGLEEWDGRVYNFAPVNYIQTPYQRTNLFAEANFELTDNLRFRSAVRANFRESAQELAPLPYTSESDPGYPVVSDGLPFNGISADNFYLVEAVTAAGLPREPVINARRRVVETTRRFTQDVTQYHAVFGLEGDFNGLQWQANYNTGYRSRIDTDFGQWFGPNLQNALGPSALDDEGVPRCFRDVNDPDTLIADCVPLNLFGGPGTITQEMLDYVGIDLVDTRLTTHNLLDLSVTGDAFDLPGGRMGWAAGVGYWGQNFTYTPDSGKQQDAVTGNTGAGTDGSLYSKSVYGELLAPVLDNVTVAAGVRWDDYNRFGSDTTWQLGLEWQAIDTVKLRATRGTVFRAPTIENLFAGLIDSFPTYSDPCIPGAGEPLPPGCAQIGVQSDSQLRARIGGNRNLKPETGDTLTAGVVWTPRADLSLTVDYWTVEIEDGISSLGVQFILDDCYLNQNAASCALITRAPNYDIDHVLDFDLNVAQQGAKGIDTEFRYGFDTGVGRFNVSLLWSHLLERTKTAFPGAPEDDLGGRFTDPTAEDGGAYAENKVNYSIQWIRDDLSLGYLGEYISSLDADTFLNFPIDPYIQKIDSQLYHDLFLNYSFRTGSQLSLGITNVTDEEPPFIEVGFNATTDPSTYRLFGRGYYLRFTQNF